MPTGPVQLNQSAQATADTTNSATITFPAARLGRTLQGSVSVSGSPPGTAWSVAVGGQVLGILFAPGPYGPVQILSGQALTLTATNTLVHNQNYVATLSGVDDPAENPTPYNGPNSVTFPGNQGGLLQTNLQVGGGPPNIPAPPSGFAYRIHSITITGNPSTATNCSACSTPTNNPFFSTTMPVGPFGQTFLLNGLLIVGEIFLTGGNGTFVFFQYDLVAI